MSEQNQGTPPIRPRVVRLRPDTQWRIERYLGGPAIQRDLARRWKTSQPSVSRWLTGQIRIPIEHAEDLADTLGVSLKELMFIPQDGQDEQNGQNGQDGRDDQKGAAEFTKTNVNGYGWAAVDPGRLFALA